MDLYFIYGIINKEVIMDLKDSKVKNFSLVNQPESCVNAYDQDCLGCKAVGADIMLTFGSNIEVLGSNNKSEGTETYRFVDVFLTKIQAEHLLKQLQKSLKP